MIDPSEMEIAAMQSCLAPLGDYVASVGMTKGLNAYSKKEVLGLIDVIVTAYQEKMTIEHERIAQRDRAFLEERLAKASTATRTGGVPF